MSDTNDDGRQTQSIGDMLDISVGDDWPYDFDFSEEGEAYDQHTQFEREIAFDILWDETGEYPPVIDSDVVDAILDDTDHEYRIEYADQVRTVKATGIALFAYLDPDADVEVGA